MSEYESHRTNYSRSQASRANYSPESNTDFEDTIADRTLPNMIDDTNIIMKTPQSLDDLLDIDAKNNQSEGEKDGNDNENDEKHDDDDDDDDDQSTQLSIDDSPRPKRKTRSTGKSGKLHRAIE